MINVGIMRYYSDINGPGQYLSSAISGSAGVASSLWQGIQSFNYQHIFNGLDDFTEPIRIWGLFSGSNHIIQADGIYQPKHTHALYLNGSTIALRADNARYYGGFATRGNGSTTAWLAVGSFSTTLYFLLSVYLAERVTGDNKAYKQAAIDSAEWIIKWAYDENTHLVKTFTWDMYLFKEWGSSSLSPHVTGLFVEGLSVLADVTGEQKWKALATDICDAAMDYRDWHDDEGIFKFVSSSGPLAVDDENMFRGLLIRGLLVWYQRNPTNLGLRNKIRSYTNVQFNELRECARYRGSYSVVWTGASGAPNVYSEMAALEAIMAAIIMNYY